MKKNASFLATLVHVVRKAPLFQYLSSLRLAVPLLLVLAAVLAGGTICESKFGMRGAHLLVYSTPWFFALLGLLGINIFCAAAIRFPWKAHQTGFVMAHAGILILLGGSLLTYLFGTDGSLPVSESASNQTVQLSQAQLWVSTEGQFGIVKTGLPESPAPRRGSLAWLELAGKPWGLIDGFIPHAESHWKVKDDPSGIGPVALQVALFNQRFFLTRWLIGDYPSTVEPPQSRNTSSQVSLGPAVLKVTEVMSEQEARAFLESHPRKNAHAAKASDQRGGVLLVSMGEEQVRVLVLDALHRKTRVGNYVLIVDRYLPYAVVEKQKLVSRNEIPVNPAVVLRVSKDGREEEHIVFARFPDFSTQHPLKGARKDAFPLRIQYEHPAQEGGAFGQNASAGQGALEFAWNQKSQKLAYRIRRPRSVEWKTGIVKPEETLSTGWMDLQFKVLRVYGRALVEEAAEEAPEDQRESTPFAVHITFPANRPGGAPQLGSQAEWIFENDTKSVALGKQSLFLTATREKKILPFSVFLRKFRVHVNPGTEKASAYESDVVVVENNKSVREATISMNAPLTYGGYTFYQASYQVQEGQPPVSVFAVNRDPGRWVKYLGSSLIVLGIIVMFALNPHYWSILFSRSTSSQ